MLALALLVVAAAPTSEDARLVTDLVGAAAAKRAGIAVVTSEDLRRAVDVEATRQSMGCSASNCLAEVAAAMGARFVLYGNLSRLGDEELVLTLATFDSNDASATGRATLRGSDVTAIVDQIEGAIPALLDGVVARSGGAPSRLVVLDVELRVAEAPPAALPAWAWAGAGVAALGVVGVGVGVALDAAAVQANAKAIAPETPQVDVGAHVSEQQQNATAAAVAYVAGGALLIGGAVTFGLGFVE